MTYVPPGMKRNESVSDETFHDHPLKLQGLQFRQTTISVPSHFCHHCPLQQILDGSLLTRQSGLSLALNLFKDIYFSLNSLTTFV